MFTFEIVESLNDIIFYSLESAIKTYRQFAQRNINAAGLDMTVDQWLILNVLNDNNQLKQSEIAEKVFKDAASITRIIDLMIKKGYLSRALHDSDRRRSQLKLTREGKKAIIKARDVINKNRSIAIRGISKNKINVVRTVLAKIKTNCNPK
jgi:MarR family transcriptional regulator, transcriptional regulator for hemolysin